MCACDCCVVVVFVRAYPNRSIASVHHMLFALVLCAGVSRRHCLCFCNCATAMIVRTNVRLKMCLLHFDSCRCRDVLISSAFCLCVLCSGTARTHTACTADCASQFVFCAAAGASAGITVASAVVGRCVAETRFERRQNSGLMQTE